MQKRFERINAPIEKPVDLMNLFDLMKIGLTMLGDYYYVSKTSKISCEQYATKFKNPHIKKWLAEQMSSGYNLMSFLYMSSHISARDGGIPLGGSKKMAERRFTAGGDNGQIFCAKDLQARQKEVQRKLD